MKHPIRRDIILPNHPDELSQKKLIEEKPEAKLQELVDKAKEVLFVAKTRFPYDLFPDTIMVDELKITVDHGSFFKTFDVETILLEEIEDVKVSSALFLYRVDIVRKGEKDPLIIKNLSKRDALRMKRLLLGIFLARKEEIDISQLSKNQLVEKLETLGRGEERNNNFSY